jgi:uncharacterized protein YbbC (DUF1343 family)
MNDERFNELKCVNVLRKIRNLIAGWLLSFLVLIPTLGCTQNTEKDERVEGTMDIITGAAQTNKILEFCSGKTVGIVANQTALIGNTHLIDTLINLGVDVKVIFAPEHGFRGDVSDGEHIADGKDVKTGLPIVSLYGKNKKISPLQMNGVDLIIFDIQDVGARFYTFISTMHYVMEAAAEQRVEVLILDRPNPNGHYVDGPVLKKGFESFVGMHPVALVHGMTIGEYAQMINGEGWLAESAKCQLSIIACINYTHQSRYRLPVKPSPNLPNMTSVYLYPSLALFEGTEVSVGRGTNKPFQQIGMPNFTQGNNSFTPVSIANASVNPPHKGVLCKGFDLARADEYRDLNEVNIEWLIMMYENAPNKENFFLKSGFFNKLAGTDELMNQLKAGNKEDEIRDSWQDGLNNFKATRKKYLLYPDFE